MQIWNVSHILRKFYIKLLTYRLRIGKKCLVKMCAEKLSVMTKVKYLINARWVLFFATYHFNIYLVDYFAIELM